MSHANEPLNPIKREVDPLIASLYELGDMSIGPRADKSIPADERKQLDESIATSFEQAKNGQLIDADEVLAKLRAIR